ncbi:MAG: hypothetical protein ABFS16_09750 [Bacteroidota bacterium]
MQTIKKIVLYVTGPGVIAFEAVVLFIHLFTPTDTKPWIIGGLFVFFLVFIPLYSVEYFRQNFGKEEYKKIRFKKRNKRTEWEGGNIHGKTPTEVERPGRLFNK